MKRQRFALSARFLLFVMLATFLSPGWGLGWVSSHDQLEHAQLPYGNSEYKHQYDVEHEHDEAHSFIGHLFSHMPATVTVLAGVATPPPALAASPEPFVQFAPAERDPPFRPPRFSLPS